MDWSNERYVRLYTRDTETVLLQSWQARAVFREMLRKCDRAGVVECRTGPRGLSVILNMPADVVEAHLPELLADGSVATCDVGYVLPNFIEAQEAKQSDRQRARESREKRRDRARAPGPVTKRDDVENGHTASQPRTNRDTVSRDVTDGHKTNENVTRGHTVSHGVTPAVLSRAKPTQPEPATTHAAGDPGADRPAPEPDRSTLVTEASRILCVAANQAIDARYGEQTRPLRASAGHTVALAQQLLESAIPVDFAADAIRTLIANRSDPEPPGAMTWFAKGIARLWGEQLARQDVSRVGPASIGAVIRGGSFSDGLRAIIAEGER